MDFEELVLVKRSSCSILGIDLLAMIAFVAKLVNENTGLHMVFSILIGIAAALVFFILAKIPYVGRLLQAALGVVWGIFAYALIDTFFHYGNVGLMRGLSENDPIWYWTIIIVVNLIFIGIHIAAFNED